MSRSKVSCASFNAKSIESPSQCQFCEIDFVLHREVNSKKNFHTDYRNLYVCESCFSFNNLLSDIAGIDTAHQASFHEKLFGVDIINGEKYFNEVAEISRIFLTDYSIYFGDRNEELICDVGSGCGTLIKALLENDYKAVGCEYSSKLVEAGRTNLGLTSDEFFQLDAWDLPAYLTERSVRPTILILWHVIEHIEGSLKLIESLVEACSDELTIIIQTPLPVPEYVFPEHLFFPSTETFHYLGERINLPVKLLYVIPYTRYLTCILSNKKVPSGLIYPREADKEGFSAIGQLIAQLNAGLIELDGVTKDQYTTILRHQNQINVLRDKELVVPTLADELLSILIGGTSSGSDCSSSNMQKQLQEILLDNLRMRSELLRVESQLDLLKDVLLDS